MSRRELAIGRHFVPLALLWLGGAALRLTVLAVPPVLPLIHADLGLSEAAVGALGACRRWSSLSPPCRARAGERPRHRHDARRGHRVVVGRHRLRQCGMLVLMLALPPLLSAPDDVHRMSAAMFTISYPCAVAIPSSPASPGMRPALSMSRSRRSDSAPWPSSRWRQQSI